MFEFNFDVAKQNTIHFIGIGGISMSGLAEILLSRGFTVTGSDNTDSHIVRHLRDHGARIFIGHSPSNILDAKLVIYTDAIPENNVELVAARSSGVEVVDRATFLGAMMRNFKHSVAVSGTHGKTTTTSMIATIINYPEIDPTILLGGELDSIGGNAKLGSNNYLLTEACEYKANILKYYPSIAIVLNMDEDHLDYFKSIAHIADTFKGYIDNVGTDGIVIGNADDFEVSKLIKNTDSKVISFGVHGEADFKAENISYDSAGHPEFDLIAYGENWGRVSLKVMGLHNVYNALAAITAASCLPIERNDILMRISNYGGVHRRLETKGYLGGIRIIDDYAHHPTEIRASLEALRKSTGEKIYCIFQPHTFTRTRILLDSFSEAFKDADKIIIADIYAARELDNGEVHSKDLVERIRSKGSDAIYLGSFSEIEDYVLGEVSESDVIVTMGAGNVYQIGEHILERNYKRATV